MKFSTTKLLLICFALVIGSCAPKVTYKGKFGTYSANPDGFVIIPYYAK
jgi:hypothetical protein